MLNTVPLDLPELVDLLPDLVCVVGTDGTFAFVVARDITAQRS